MDGDLTFFILMMTLVVAGAVLLLIFMRSRLRLAELKVRIVQAPGAAQEIELLGNENAGLRDKIGRLEERLAVLERIATDPAERTAFEIERLR